MTTDINTNNGKLAEETRLLKEYELCWQGIQHFNTRLWSSASIFISGSLVALSFMGTRQVQLNGWAELTIVQTIASVIVVALSLYFNIFKSINLQDCIEFYRLEELERHLGLWRTRYHTHMHELPADLKDSNYTPEEAARLIMAEEQILKRLQITKDKLSSFTRANKSFNGIIYIIILSAIAFAVRAWLIVLGLL